MRRVACGGECGTCCSPTSIVVRRSALMTARIAVCDKSDPTKARPGTAHHDASAAGSFAFPADIVSNLHMAACRATAVDESKLHPADTWNFTTGQTVLCNTSLSDDGMSGVGRPVKGHLTQVGHHAARLVATVLLTSVVQLAEWVRGWVELT